MYKRQLRDRLALWTESVVDQVTGVWPRMPPGVTDRPADCWEPLLAIADAAGGHWPTTARVACVELCKVVESREASLGVRLLTDLKTVFGDHDRLATETILRALHALEESPWDDLRGRALDARGLAWRLRAYGITSTKVKIDGKPLQGYRIEELHDAWSRYIPTPEGPEPPEPVEPGRSDPVHEVPDGRQVPEPEPRTEPAASSLTSTVPRVPEVPPIEDLGAWTRDGLEPEDVIVARLCEQLGGEITEEVPS